MRMPPGFKLNDGREWHSQILTLIKNIYSLKQAWRVWNQYLHKGLTKLGNIQSKIYPCLYYRSGLLMIIASWEYWNKRLWKYQRSSK